MSSSTKAYAVVVPESVQTCRDILPASSDLTKHTPCPFGVGIYAWKEEGSSRKSMLQLIYISEEAALDRSADRHILNGMGVHAGWYVVAQPGRFDVHVSHVNANHYGLPWEDGLEVKLDVDGQYTNKKFSFVQGDPNVHERRKHGVFKGFVEKRTTAANAPHKKVKVIRPFAFEKVLHGVESNDHTPTDVGTITLKVYAGVRHKRSHSTVKDTTYDYQPKVVNEKAIAKQGSTMKVSRNLSSVTSVSKPADFKTKNKRYLAQADIKIYVRERSWLRSRRLIDDDGQPVAYGLFQKLLQKDQPVRRTRMVSEIVKVEDEPTKKKPRNKEQMVLLPDVEPVQPGEVIDLL